VRVAADQPADRRDRVIGKQHQRIEIHWYPPSDSGRAAFDRSLITNDRGQSAAPLLLEDLQHGYRTSAALPCS
jgi:hypothetical protein